MEIVLLWLDDLDDLLFAALAATERLRRGCLQVGLGAAVVLALADQSLIAASWTAAAGGVAGASLGLWLTVLMATGLSGAAEGLPDAA